jgi:hypothetical protein
VCIDPEHLKNRNRQAQNDTPIEEDSERDGRTGEILAVCTAREEI